MFENITPEQSILLTGAVVGAGAFGFGLWRRYEAAHLKAFPLSRIPGVTAGAAASVSGTIQETPTMNSPIRGTPCVFYRLLTERQRKETYYHKGEQRTRTHWETVSDKVDGGFLVGDGFGFAVVVPSLRCLDFNESGQTSTDLSILGWEGERRTEWVLRPGQSVFASGIPQGGNAFIAAVTAHESMNVAPGVIAKVKEHIAAGHPVAAFYLDAVDTVGDRSYEAAVNAYAESGTLLMQFGGVCALGSLLMLAMFHFHVF